MRIDLTDQAAVVTGGAQGIGEAIARLLLENGARVMIGDVQQEEGQATAARLSALGPCRFRYADVSDPASAEALLSEAVAEWGRLDLLINNAGVNVTGDRKDVDEYADEDWRRIMSVDLDGVFYCSRAAARQMIAQGSGRIINLGSVLGSVPARRQIAYVAAKAAVHNLTRSMALELAPHHILVNAVAPGSTLTEGTRKLFYSDDAAQAEFRERMLSHVPLGRPGEPQDIANAVLFLCGEESKYITGHVLTVDGGWTCGYTRDF